MSTWAGSSSAPLTPLRPPPPAPHLEHKLISHRKRPVQLPRQRVDFLLKLLCIRQDLAETRAVSLCLGWAADQLKAFLHMSSHPDRACVTVSVGTRVYCVGLLWVMCGSACQSVESPCSHTTHSRHAQRTHPPWPWQHTLVISSFCFRMFPTISRMRWV